MLSVFKRGFSSAAGKGKGRGIVETSVLGNGIKVATQSTWDKHTSVGWYFD